MIKPVYFLPLFLITLSCSSNNSQQESDLDVKSVDLKHVSDQKKELVKEIKKLQQNLESKNFEEIANHLDTPKRVEELELKLDNSKIRNAIESSSSRLSIDAIRSQYDILYEVLDLNIVHDAIKSIPESELLQNDKNSTTVNIGNCEFSTDISVNEKEVKISIKSDSQLEECKKEQQWRFISNGEALILDRRYYL